MVSLKKANDPISRFSIEMVVKSIEMSNEMRPLLGVCVCMCVCKITLFFLTSRLI